MARVKGPLLSESAHGKFSDVLVFQKQRWGNMSRWYHIPKYADTKTQRINTSDYGNAIGEWRIAPKSVKDDYRKKASGKKMSNLNYFVKEYMRYRHNAVYGLMRYGITKYGERKIS